MTATAEEGSSRELHGGRRSAVRAILRELRILPGGILFWQSVILEKE